MEGGWGWGLVGRVRAGVRAGWEAGRARAGWEAGTARAGWEVGRARAGLAGVEAVAEGCLFREMAGVCQQAPRLGLGRRAAGALGRGWEPAAAARGWAADTREVGWAGVARRLFHHPPALQGRRSLALRGHEEGAWVGWADAGRQLDS